MTHLIPGFSRSVTLDDSSHTVTPGSLMFMETWWYASALWSLKMNIFSWFQTTSDSALPAYVAQYTQTNAQEGSVRSDVW